VKKNTHTLCIKKIADNRNQSSTSTLSVLSTRPKNWCYAFFFSKGIEAMSPEYSLSDVLERIYENQLGLEAALMELALQVEKEGFTDVGENVRGALCRVGENAGYIKQGIAKIKGRNLK
jgi:hypothetical protein